MVKFMDTKEDCDYMNLEDLINGDGLQQDEWSLTIPTFGEESQIEIIGWSGRSWSNKHYILRCSKCSQDAELFGEGYFRSLKSDLVNGKVPCGCAKSPRWSKEQYATLCLRKAKGLGYTFIGFEGEWKGAFTKIKMLCGKHGEWSSGTVSTLTSMGQGCRRCRDEATIETLTLRNTKPEEVMIAAFFRSGAFHPGTKFYRSERRTKQGKRVYWFMSCPECGEVGESASNHLQKGHRPCACSNQRQQECYINWLIDETNNTVAIKFGIARDSKQRIKKQDRQSVYTLKQHSVHSFPDVASCKKAERECLQELECGVILKRDMKDGWSETTWVYNLGKIIEIYERNGGVLNV